MPERELFELTPDVWVATSRLYQTASTIVAKAGKALLIDPAWTPDELEDLADTIEYLGLTVTAGFSTHTLRPPAVAPALRRTAKVGDATNGRTSAH